MTTFKTNFTSIYEATDPRPYFRSLLRHDYQIPHTAQGWIEAVLQAAMHRHGHDLTVLDLCCSYGINGLLMRHDVAFPDIANRYTDPRSDDMTSEQLVRADSDYFASRRRRERLRVLGLDVSGPAIMYGVRAGALSEGWAVNLEHTDAGPDLAAGLRSTRLIVCTGGIGYVGADTFRRVLGCIDQPDETISALFVLRQVDMRPIQEVYRSYGVELQRVPSATVRQRRFTSADEEAGALDALEARGLDPVGRESEGWYYADLYIASPRDVTLFA